MPLADAQRVYVARTYAYVAAGKRRARDRRRRAARSDAELYQRSMPTASSNDARDVVVGSTNASLFAYVADGKRAEGDAAHVAGVAAEVLRLQPRAASRS